MIAMSVLSVIKNFLRRARTGKDKSIAPATDMTYKGSNGAASKQWTGIDLDGTLALYDENSSLAAIGAPVPDMMLRVKAMLAEGEYIKIFTARAAEPHQLVMVRQWLKVNGLPPLEITNVKDYNMHRLYDDRCIQVETNTGRLIIAGESS